MKARQYSEKNAADFAAPMSLRVGAFVIDYVLLLIPPVVGLAIGRLLGLDGARLVGSGIVSIGWFISVGVFFLNQILFPVLTGQTIGKRVLGLRMIETSGSIPILTVVLKRHLLGYLVNAITLGIGLLPAIGKTGRGLHDLIAGTIVIRARTE